MAYAIIGILLIVETHEPRAPREGAVPTATVQDEFARKKQLLQS
jgi:hypothetical protein